MVDAKRRHRKKTEQLSINFQAPQPLEFIEDDMKFAPILPELPRGLPGEFWNGMIWVSDDDVAF